MENNNEYFEFEGYRITDEQCFKIGENEIPVEFSEQMSILSEAATDKRNKTIIGQLSDLIARYPNCLSFQNFLVNAYLTRGEKQKSHEITERMYVEHPNYLFSKLQKAETYIYAGKPKEVMEILGKRLELKDLYPDRDWFHLSELTSFLGVVIMFYISIGDLRAANIQLSRLHYINPEHRTTRFMTEKLMLADKLVRGKKLESLHKENEIKVIVNKKPLNNIVSLNAPCPCGSGKKYKRCCKK